MDRQALKKVMPMPVWQLGSNVYWWHRNRGRHELARTFSSRWRESLRELRKYKDAHQGERCFVIGNGPSLRQTDLSLLEKEFTFGLNRIYLLFPELGFTTNCLVSVNDLVVEQFSEDMRRLELPKFITWRSRNCLNDDPRTIFIDTDFTGEANFSGNAEGRLYEGFTVTYVALQLAYYMGFREANLVGVDHNFQTKGPANLEVVSEGDDPNHFAPNYFGKGAKWQLPDLEGSERAYCMAREAYQKTGRKIVDATVGGKLTVFPKVEYKSLF